MSDSNWWREAADSDDRARWGEITINAQPFGTRLLRADRFYTPLRWIYGPGRTLRLINDTGGPARVFLYHFAIPDKGLLVESDFGIETAIPSAGGLYQAEAGSSRASIVVPPADHSCPN